jgi:hypothetical protein
MAHASQLGDWVDEWVRTQSRRAALEAMERGMGSMEYAEAFYRMYTGELNSGAALKEVFGPLPEGMKLPERTERASLGDRRP